jgi:hypothetical protein
MKTSEMTGLLMDMIKNRDLVLQALSNSLEQAGTIKKGLDMLAKSIEGKDIIADRSVDFDKIFHSLLKANKQLASSVEVMSVLLILYVAEGDFGSDSALMLNRLGKGQEALRELFKQKLRGG